MDSIIRIVGAISLWSIEIVMMLRVYALYNCSKRVAIFNTLLFLGSIAGFLWVLIHNAQRRRAVIADSIHLPLPGCPSIHSGVEWLQWVPATVFEGVLFCFALFKTLKTTTTRLMKRTRVSLYSVLLRDNLFYFFGITVLLVFNNLMVVGVTKIPWFSYSPFHAAMGILTTRMLINLRKAVVQTQVISSGPLGASIFPRRVMDNRREHSLAGDVSTWHVATVTNTHSD
ncbi:hypothetical protein H2248_003160 [Termitomyces sp. 'cryptogamus']|nr:hypothetical protein H2248_003160 [Termitomyces sp. 'cryptogamus']